MVNWRSRVTFVVSIAGLVVWYGVLVTAGAVGAPALAAGAVEAPVEVPQGAAPPDGVDSRVAHAPAGADTLDDRDETDWIWYEHEGAGIGLSHPASWNVTVAREREGTASFWAPTVLREGELHKLTFREEDDVFCPGQYEIRVLSNPQSLGLDALLEQFDLSDLWGGSLTDTALAGRPAKSWVRWSYDSLTREFLAVIDDGVVHLRYDQHNPNDPDFHDHKDVYARMTSSLRVHPGAGTPDGGDPAPAE